MAIVFRSWIATGFDNGFGDRADGIIEISLLEHWRDVLAGTATWNNPLYFWPQPDTLGYNDGYLLFGLDYAFWRVFLDPFRADMANVFVFKTIGFVSAWKLAECFFRLDRRLSLWIALLFSIGSGIMQQADHAQLQSVALLPVSAMLAITVVRSEMGGRNTKARLLSVCWAGFMAVWLMTAYYMAFFTLYFSVVFAFCWFATTGNWRPARFVQFTKKHGLSIVTLIVAFFMFNIPFLNVYLPKGAESGGHALRAARSYLVWFYDPANVGERNYLWGWILTPLRNLFTALGGARLADEKLGNEHVTGFPLLLLTLVFLSLRSLMTRSQLPILRALALTITVTWCLTLQLGPLSPWALPYWLLPGAQGIRVVLRYQLFLSLPVLLIVAIAQRERAMRLLTGHPGMFAVLITAMIVEQLGPVTSAHLSRSQQLELLATPRPPSYCRSFYIVKARAAESLYKDNEADALYPHNVDAMMLAMLWHTPTLNGYATFLPPDWVFADVRRSDYDGRVLAYVHAHRLTGVCRLDARASVPWHRVA